MNLIISVAFNIYPGDVHVEQVVFHPITGISVKHTLRHLKVALILYILSSLKILLQ